MSSDELPSTLAEDCILVRYTYRLEHAEGRVYAQCLELDAAGEGKAREEAVESLRTALKERLVSPDAVAPPSIPGDHHIVLREAEPAATCG